MLTCPIFLLGSCDLPAETALDLTTNATDIQEEIIPSSISIVYERHEDISDEKSRNVSIKYPQVSGLKNIGFMKELNEELSPPYFEGDEDNGLTLEVRSEYAIIGDNILSFRFNRFCYRVDAVHPSSDMWALTVNTETGEHLDLSDIVLVDENFRELFLSGLFVSDRFSHEDILELERLDGLYNRIYDFYLTEKALGVIVGTSHAAGDYLTFEISYTDIGDLLHSNFKFLIGL